MSDNHNGRSPRRQFVKPLHDDRSIVCIKSTCRLVRENNRRVHGKSPRNRNTLLLTPREFIGIDIRQVGHANLLKHRKNHISSTPQTSHPGSQFDIPKHRQRINKVIFLKNEPHAFTAHRSTYSPTAMRNVNPLNPHLTRINRFQAGQAIQES